MSNAPNLQQNRYKADLREVRFLLFEQFKLDQILGQGPFEAWGPDEVQMVVDEAYKFSCEVLGPLNAVGDRTGCRLEGGQVYTPPGFKEAWNKLYEAGWMAVSAEPEYGGQGGPFTLHITIQEFMSGANSAFIMYPGLAFGAAEVIQLFGTDAQKEHYLRTMYGGKWGGTMCLTEPQAGSDVGSSRTTAKKLPDGKYAIRGTKIFISGGDHDCAENIVHLVLARVDNAPAGTKGLSLFIVPKVRTNADGSLGEANDVTVGAIEHKMGINGSATCVLNFGENDGCVGELVGTVENQGMSQMFRMMNGARISVGLQGVAVASAAYLNALEYARDRKQGPSINNWKDATAPRVAIVEHPDVRRMLLDMKSRVEGIRALIIKLTRHFDMTRVLQGKDDEQALYHQGQVDLLVPLVKAYGSDQGFRVCETAIQTYGGAGYIKDYPVEQYCRDAKVFSIYEGTNHIQAMDLVGRKLGQRGGANLQGFLGDVAAFVKANEKHPVLGKAVKELGEAQEAVAGTAMRLLGWFQMGKMPMVPLSANRFLEMMSETAVAWLLLDAAKIALDAQEKLPAGDESASERAFYEGKKHTALYYALNVLPHVRLSAEILGREDSSALEISTESFATV
ncbi:acyl-CoA dehydrogenase [Chondromyces apiculatus]|uniref:3-methylmercaptopropionyl-CoA dehydrogenase n=1 Tax=Chondromyces apiculatus DSM 436 TaxID=1192034 RepID=A0A017SXL4_9BACT|nr:acyl-CoA dehydrogenase [Chondromyces apiculatus]EYF01497.1 Acyl-CoA dehydrogenase [Chondromyces apiculatus DSM 436]